MGSKLTRSTELVLREEEEKRDVKTRYDNLCLVLRRKTTQDLLLAAGGHWDNKDRRFLPGPSPKARVVDLIESQIDFAMWFALWLTAYQSGGLRATRLVLTAGERRGGKTTIGLLCTIAMLLAVPDSIAWAVSSTYSERDELERAIARFVPACWYVYKGAPRFRYVFHNGSVLRNISGDDPDVLKQGQVDMVLINEGQKMSSRVLTNSLPGTIDRGGLVIVAANPADKTVGLWVNDLKEAIDLHKFRSDAVKFFGFDAKLNAEIDQKAKTDVGEILHVVDPAVAAADDLGLWLPIGDMAYPAFRTVNNVKPAPDLGGEFTRTATRNKLGREYEYVNGMDFQDTPHMAGVSLRVFRGPDGRAVYWVVGELIRSGTEDDFLDAVDDLDLWTPENAVWIGDASGTWQNGAHTKGRCSFDIFKSRRWHILPPQKAKDANRKPSNPEVADRLGVVNNLLSQGRLLIDPDDAPRVAIALKKCALKSHKPSGKYAHLTDALGYALWFLEPRVKPAKRNPKREAWSVPSARRSIDY